jgi:hypothetical protein
VSTPSVLILDNAEKLPFFLTDYRKGELSKKIVTRPFPSVKINPMNKTS